MEAEGEELRKAAAAGNIEFLERVMASQPPDDYWLSKFQGVCDGGNMFHGAAYYGKVDFIRKAIKLLPTHIVQQLLAQQHNLGWTPLHDAAREGVVESVIIMLGFYKSYSGPPLVRTDINHPLNKPWLALINNSKRTPLHVALEYGKEDCAIEIMAMDMELLCNMLDDHCNSLLYLAVKDGYYNVAEKILCSDGSYSVHGQNGFNPLHFAHRCPENITKLLLEKHPECLDANLVHQWAKEGSIGLLKLISGGEFPAARSKFFQYLISVKDEENGDTPLHIVIRTGNSEFVQIFMDNMPVSLKDSSPWKVKNKNGDTPFHLSFSLQLQQIALLFLSLDQTLYKICNNKGESPLLCAVREGCEQLVEEILKIDQNPPYNMLRRNDGMTVLHFLHNCSEKIAKKLLEKFWWMIKLRDDKGITALDKAKEANAPWLMHLLMNHSLILREPFDWTTSCKRDEGWATLAFIDTCQDLQELCRREIDTPLHHIRLLDFRDCLNFLKIPSIADLKNTTDKDGATPLHRALERKDKHLVKAFLIDIEVERNIRDYNGKTAMDLLAKLCKEDASWAEMCKQIKINPYLRTTYIQPGTNLGEMRSTLSVVAALLATITFAAGFTLPGGLNSETGNAMLGKKASFIVFLLADVYAMCTSMLVLFCLIWSMVSTRDMASLLIDRSVLILMQSLYGTMVAFMTGIYTVMAHGSLWVAIIIFVMCSFIIILTHKAVLHNILSKLIPASNQEDTNYGIQLP